MSDQKISLALSGSGFKLNALIGAVSALIDNGYDITEIAGTSGGSIIGALFATGMSPATMKDLSDNTDYADIMPWSYWGWWDGLSNSDNLLKWLSDHTGSVTCGNTIIPYHAICSDIATNTTFSFNSIMTPEVSVAYASVCSASIPFVYQKRKYLNHILLDGGMSSNLPLSYLNVTSTRIGIELYSTSSVIEDMSYVQYAGRVMDRMLTANEHTQIALAVQDHATIVPVNTFDISMLDRHMSKSDRQRLYDSGYQAVEKTYGKN
jgi:NTE family protein